MQRSTIVSVPGCELVVGNLVRCIICLGTIQPAGFIREPLFVAVIATAVDVFLHQESFQIQGYGVVVVIHTICLNRIAIGVCLLVVLQSYISEVVCSFFYIERVSIRFRPAFVLVRRRSIDRSDIQSVIV